tara:strand:- start:10729 stop:11823 length:1095 start_codon:yes stop_codon:yes gene_type:complete
MTEIVKKYGPLKLAWHPEKLEALRDEKITAPICVRIKPTNKCNHRCFYCSYDPDAEDKNLLSGGFKRNDEIPRDKMMEILDDFKEIGVKAITYSGGGEPLIYPHIEEAFKKTLENKIDLSIITNGQTLSGVLADYLKNAKWVRISLDACSKEIFSESRKVSGKFYEKLEKNLQEFAKNKEDFCELGINFVVHHLNKDTVYEAARHFKQLGVNHVKFTPRWIDKKGEWEKYHEPFKESVIEQIKRANRELVDENFSIFDTYENDFSLTGVPERTYSKCAIMQTVPVIGADSVVYFCHDKTYMKNGALGSIKDKSFKDLWFSPEAEKIFREFNAKKECPQHCTYDSRNILVQDFIKGYDPHHINFP